MSFALCMNTVARTVLYYVFSSVLLTLEYYLYGGV